MLLNSIGLVLLLRIWHLSAFLCIFLYLKLESLLSIAIAPSYEAADFIFLYLTCITHGIILPTVHKLHHIGSRLRPHTQPIMLICQR